MNNSNLRKAILAVISSADNTGCSDDLTVVSRSAVEKLEKFAESAANKYRYFKTVLTVTVLTEDGPVSDDMSLEDIAREIDTGDWVGNIEITERKELTGKEMVDALSEAGSTSEFFQLDENGDRLGGEDDEDEDDDE